MKNLCLLFFLWLFTINGFALIANNRLILQPDTAYTWINPLYQRQQQGWNIENMFARWDSYWYTDIAANGYNLRGGNDISNVVFFPVYPLLIHTLGNFYQNNYNLAGWIISITFSLLSAIYLYKLVKDFHPQSDPLQAVFLMLIFPSAVFLNAVYSESTFLFFSIASFYYLRRDRMATAGLFGFLAALTRFSGILLFPILLIDYFTSHREKPFQLKSLYTALIPLGTFLFFLYYKIVFGNFFLYFTEEKKWGRGFSFNQLFHFSGGYPSVTNSMFDLFFVLFTLITGIIIIHRIRLSYGLYILLSILIPVSSGSLISTGRFSLVLFPIFILGASIKNEGIKNIWILASALFFALFLILFVTHYWMG